MNIKQNFIKTMDPKIADILRASNYTELTESGSKYYCFINNGKLNFDADEIDMSKINYTNTLCI